MRGWAGGMLSGEEQYNGLSSSSEQISAMATAFELLFAKLGSIESDAQRAFWHQIKYRPMQWLLSIHFQ